LLGLRHRRRDGRRILAAGLPVNQAEGLLSEISDIAGGGGGPPRIATQITATGDS
jgi:hypothetical protein